MLIEQCIFTADSVASRHVRHFYEQTIALTGSLKHRYTAIDEPRFFVNLGRWQTQFIGIRRAILQYAIQYVLELGVIAYDLQQRLMSRAVFADA